MYKKRTSKIQYAENAEPLTGDRYFVSRLMEWHKNGNNRQMPWKGVKDPYKIWLSEIILQQTRVAQGTEYYLRILKAYPTIQQLAAAPDQEVFKLWEGLGYYSRCRNLLATARLITKNYNGVFPASYEQLLQFPGIGPYTAAAIASFAFELPYAVVDGNVFRVLARFWGDDTPTDSANGKKHFSSIANQLINKKLPGAYNQAIMDFGATVCKPQQPLCGQCCMQKKCLARLQGNMHHLPVKEKTIQKSVRYFTYWVFEYRGKLAIRERAKGDIWQQLSEYYLAETDYPVEWNAEKVSEWLSELGINRFVIQSISSGFKQQLTHQTIHCVFISIRLQHIPSFLHSYEWVTPKQLNNRAFPQIINQWMCRAESVK